ncbi:hypothetical protein [Archangium violaceum]|uniref:Uncharacterized protein n=1 Tax=Archangium violaceum Cb vi76 TaxID=1406225 RepID=A0A084T287_9BACT|nr:hypothetical protein [Archangium violaceum]KFA94822.1 hypothetical protein Q664_00170 [Archangium violaceum Cb vi76]
MANYDQPKYVTKRPRYFNNQFLSEQDFIDEQKYHIDRQRRHDRLLHVSGICEGLEVTAKDAVVTVKAGTAVDEQGRHLLVATPQTLTLTREDQGKRGVYLVYREVPSDQQVADKGATGDTRFDESAHLFHEAPGGAVTDGRLLLAELTVSANGTVAELKMDNRLYSGLRLSAPGGKALTLRSSSDSPHAVLDGGLSVAQLEVKAVPGRPPLRVMDENGGELLVLSNDSLLTLGDGDRTGKLRLNAEKSYIELGAGVSGKQVHAGKVGYQLLSREMLDIVGAGTDDTNRKVNVWAEGGTTFKGPLRLSSQPLYLRDDDNYHGLRLVGVNDEFGLGGPFLFGWRGGGLGTTNNATRLALTWDDAGDIGLHGLLELGAGVPGKEDSAGKIGYQRFSEGLDLVGAGKTVPERRVKVWAEGGTTFTGPVSLPGDLKVPGLPESVRIIRGSVSRDGTKAAGNGFSVTPDGPAYTITFDSPFKDKPTVVANVEGGEDMTNNALIHSITTGGVTIWTGYNGKYSPFAFHFIAVGPS